MTVCVTVMDLPVTANTKAKLYLAHFISDNTSTLQNSMGDVILKAVFRTEFGFEVVHLRLEYSLANPPGCLHLSAKLHRFGQ